MYFLTFNETKTHNIQTSSNDSLTPLCEVFIENVGHRYYLKFNKRDGSVGALDS